MTERQKQEHNFKVVNEVLKSLLDYNIISPLDITKDQVASKAIAIWMDAENTARTKMMGMEPITLYDLTDEDDEDYE